MNTNSIVEFNTGKVKGLFISVPYNTIVEECHFKDKESLRFTLMVCYGQKNAIPSFIPIVIPEGDYRILGFSNILSEKQMGKYLGLTYPQYLKLLRDNEVIVNYSDYSNFWLVLISN